MEGLQSSGAASGGKTTCLRALQRTLSAYVCKVNSAVNSAVNSQNCLTGDRGSFCECKSYCAAQPKGHGLFIAIDIYFECNLLM